MPFVPSRLRKVLPHLYCCVLVLFGLSCTRAGRASPTPDLQALLNAAKPGDTVVLPAGAVFTGNFVLPNKPGEATITITSSEAASLPSGVRVKPSDRSHMAAIRSTNDRPALATAPGAHNYKLVGLEIYAEGVYNFGVVQLGLTENSLDKLPRQIELDRMYIHGDPKLGGKRGVAANGISIAVRNSYISDFKSLDQDTQAISGWNGPGPFQIVNNYLEAAGENIMFGGATGPIAGVVPSDIEIRGNYLFKPLSWKRGDPSFAGTAWEVKNLLELKAARRAHISGNILQNSWPSGQTGFALLLTVRTQNDSAPWCMVEDVTFENNVIRGVAGGAGILGMDGSGRTRRVIIRNNLWDVDTNVFRILTGCEDITIDHNTVINRGSPIWLDGPPSPRVALLNNIMFNVRYGIAGSDKAPGLSAISHYLPDSRVQKNIIIGAEAKAYPQGNFFPEAVEQVAFQNFASQDYRLDPKSRYRNAGTDGHDIGANIDAIQEATATVIAGH